MKIKELIEAELPDLSQPFTVNHEGKRFWKTQEKKDSHTKYEEKNDDNKPTGNAVWRHSSGKIVKTL